MNEEVVRAGGAVLWRRTPRGVEVLLVHRPKYDDWSLPKGKCESAESDEECAVREVEEETGVEIALGGELPPSSYISKGLPKLVRYWLAEVTGAEARPQNEVDELAWLSPDDAAEWLTYDRDLAVLQAAAAQLEATSR